MYVYDGRYATDQLEIGAGTSDKCDECRSWMYPQPHRVVLTAIAICAPGRGCRRLCAFEDTSVVIVGEGKQRQRRVCILDGIQEVSGVTTALDDIASPPVDRPICVRGVEHGRRRVELVVVHIVCVCVRGMSGSLALRGGIL